MAQTRLEQLTAQIIMGLTSSRNACWATVKPWTKKERDAAVLSAAREIQELLTAKRFEERAH